MATDEITTGCRIRDSAQFYGIERRTNKTHVPLKWLGLGSPQVGGCCPMAKMQVAIGAKE
jgi:hypothetical protein